MKKSIVDIKFVSYDGKYPNLCSGTLTFIAIMNDETEKEYSWKYCLSTGGYIEKSRRGYYNSHKGEWSINIDEGIEDRELFTPMVVKYLEEVVNNNVDYGCCGGCS